MATRRIADSYGGYRARLVEQLRRNGIRDLAVLRAFAETPRHLFVPPALLPRAYDDAALPIGNGQTISQPTTQARYLAALGLEGGERVLEIGTGSGYQTALLSHLAGTVVSVERLRELAEAAREALRRAGVRDVTIVIGDGTLGWRSLSPYDAMLVSAAGPDVPAPLLEQLAPRGRLVIPLERSGRQQLVRITRRGRQFAEETLGEAHFVRLYGKHGFEEGN